MKKWNTIFAIAPDCHSSVGHYSALWRTHFYEGIAGALDNVHTPENLDFSWSYASSAENIANNIRQRASVSERLRAQIRKKVRQGPVDAVLSYSRSNQIDPDLVREVQALGIPWINFFCDSIGQFEAVRELAATVTLNWFPESDAIPCYSALPPQWLCRPYALNPSALNPVTITPPATYPVGFVGMPTTNRVTILSLIRLLGCPVEIRGYGWDHSGVAAFSGQDAPISKKIMRLIMEPHRLERLWRRWAWRQLRGVAKGPLEDFTLQEFLATCQIVLGLNDARTPRGDLQSYLKFRDLEMPGYGCCYLTQKNRDIASILIPNEEVLIFDSVLEARSIIKFHEKRPDLCRAIGLRARQRILTEHTWRNRLNELQEALR